MSDQRTLAYVKLLETAALLRSGCDDYLKIYTAWDKARRAVDDFLDNPDWLEAWVNETLDDVEDSPPWHRRLLSRVLSIGLWTRSPPWG